MGRAGWMQAGVVLNNILAIIQGQAPSHNYVPDFFIEGAIKLTLGRAHKVTYATETGDSLSDFLFTSRDENLDLEAEAAWKEYGVDFEQACTWKL